MTSLLVMLPWRTCSFKCWMRVPCRAQVDSQGCSLHLNSNLNAHRHYGETPYKAKRPNLTSYSKASSCLRRDCPPKIWNSVARKRLFLHAKSSGFELTPSLGTRRPCVNGMLTEVKWGRKHSGAATNWWRRNGRQCFNTSVFQQHFSRSAKSLNTFKG